MKKTDNLKYAMNSIDMLNHDTEFWGIDQLYFNYNWYLLEDCNRVNLDELHNYMLVSN